MERTEIINEILERAVLSACEGNRHNAWWGACIQFRDNDVPQPEAAALAQEFVGRIPQNDGGYALNKAIATLRSAYKSQAREPWTETQDRGYTPRRRQPTTPRFNRIDPQIDHEKQAELREQLKTLRPFRESPAWTYLVARGIPAELASWVGVKYSPSWGSIGECIVFPVRAGDGSLVAAQGRAITGKDFRTYGTRGMGLFMTENAHRAPAVGITEAPIDALTLAYCGLPSVALCGASGLPRWFKAQLAEPQGGDIPMSRVVFMATDNDTAGNNAADALGAEIGEYGIEPRRLLPNHKDWNEELNAVGYDETRYLVDCAFNDAGLHFPVLPDPRPDLKEDHIEWLLLLHDKQSSEDFMALHAQRCDGSRIEEASE